MNPDFGYKHITGLLWLLPLIAVVIAVLLIIKKKYKFDEKFDRAVIRYAFYFIFIWEIIKTVRIVNYPDYGPVGHYPLWMAPFHICSMSFYVYPIIGSKHPGKLAEWVTPFGYSVLMIVTSIILAMPGSAALLGETPNWSFCFDNILPYQTWLFHGTLLFVSFYMALSGFYKPKWSDIYKAITVLCVLAACATVLNFTLEGSGADYMTLRYGNGNPFAFLLQGENPTLYYIVLSAISFSASALVIAATIGIRALVDKLNNKKADLEVKEAEVIA